MGAKKPNAKVKRFLLSDVASCTFTFNDGLKSKVKPSSENEMVMVRLIPHTSKSKTFKDAVIRSYSSAKNVKHLAEMCGYDTVKTFTRHFKKHFEQTPYQWMLDRKMEDIHALVINSDMTITEIAKMCDFKNVAHLVNTYTQRFGVSPHKNRILNAI